MNNWGVTPNAEDDRPTETGKVGNLNTVEPISAGQGIALFVLRALTCRLLAIDPRNIATAPNIPDEPTTPWSAEDILNREA